METVASLEDEILEIARRCVNQGPGYAQEGVVLREVQKLRHSESLPEQQAILRAWHRLFAEGKLVWGYNLENPGSPFFHISSGS